MTDMRQPYLPDQHISKPLKAYSPRITEFDNQQMLCMGCAKLASREHAKLDADVGWGSKHTSLPRQNLETSVVAKTHATPRKLPQDMHSLRLYINT